MARTKVTARMSTGGKRPLRKRPFQSATTATYCFLLCSKAATEPLSRLPNEIKRLIAKQVFASRYDQEWSFSSLLEKRDELAHQIEAVEEQLQLYSTVASLARWEELIGKLDDVHWKLENGRT